MGGTPARYASLIGVTVGNYAVRALIGRGAVGTVYLAKDCILGRQVALKVLLGSLAHNPGQVRRFQLEAQAAAPLQHHNIVGLYEAGIWKGIPFIAMEYVDGEALDHFLARKGALNWQGALHIGEQVALALTCAHAAGVVHRDVKPGNILLDRQGRVRLTDFGIARVQQQESGMPVLADFLGTPQYMSPEQCAGDPVTAQSDLFSLGVMLYEMIGGRRPFEGRTSAALIRSITSEAPVRLSQLIPGVPDDVCRLVAHLLQKAPEERPESAAVVAARIQRLQAENGGASALPEALNSFIRESMQPRTLAGDTPTPGRRETRGPRISLPAPRKRYTTTSASTQLAVLALVLCTAAGLGYWHWGRMPAPEQGPVALSSIGFTRVSSGLWQAPLPDAAWAASSLRWAGDSSQLLVQLQGQQGTRAMGASGVLSYDPDHLRVESVLTPAGPLLADSSVAVSGVLEIPVLAPLHTMPAGSPWSSAVVGMYIEDATARAVLQPWRSGTVANGALFERAARDWEPSLLDPWSTTPTGAMALHPNGEGLLTLARDAGSSGPVLREFVEHGAPEAQGLVLAEGLSDIDPASLQYTASGRWLSFETEGRGVGRQLWIVPSGDAQTAPRPLAAGRLQGRAAFSRDESLAAVTLEEQGRAEAYLVRVADGQILSELGSGAVDAESWHPSGQYLVVCDAKADGGEVQLVAVESRAPHRRHALTQVPGGVRRLVAVSRDGRWAATVSLRGDVEQIVFVDLSSLLFSQQA